MRIVWPFLGTPHLVTQRRGPTRTRSEPPSAAWSSRAICWRIPVASELWATIGLPSSTIFQPARATFSANVRRICSALSDVVKTRGLTPLVNQFV
jgi:hypothetical protein